MGEYDNGAAGGRLGELAEAILASDLEELMNALYNAPADLLEECDLWGWGDSNELGRIEPTRLIGLALESKPDPSHLWWRVMEGRLESESSDGIWDRVADNIGSIAKAFADPRNHNMRFYLHPDVRAIADEAVVEAAASADPAELKLKSQRLIYMSSRVARDYDTEDMANMHAQAIAQRNDPYDPLRLRWRKADDFQQLLLDKEPLHLVALVPAADYSPSDDWFFLDAKGTVRSCSEQLLAANLRSALAEALCDSPKGCSAWAPAELLKVAEEWAAEDKRL